MDSQDFYTQYKVVVEKVTGVLGVLPTKSPVVHEWKDDHGIDVDLSKRYRESREIIVKAYIVGTSNSDYVTKINAFQSALLAAGFRRLKFQNINKTYMVYTSEGAVIDKLSPWGASQVIGRFALRFIEPYPVNRQWTNTNVSVTITITCTRKVNIDWGDGSALESAYGTSIEKPHTFSATGKIITVYGVIENITSITVSNSTEITN